MHHPRASLFALYSPQMTIGSKTKKLSVEACKRLQMIAVEIECPGRFKRRLLETVFETEFLPRQTPRHGNLEGDVSCVVAAFDNG